MRIVFIVALMFTTLVQLTAQCDGRYENEIFENVTVERVTYSDYTNFEMDIYQPEGDTETNRPLIIIAHGGAFLFGNLENPTMVSLGNLFAKRGYVVASIQYTLAANALLLSDSLTMINVVTQAVADGKAAVRYFRKDNAEDNIYRIDPDEIWFGGNSAGAILAMHLAYLDEGDEPEDHIMDAVIENGGWPGNRGNDGYPHNVKGIINLAGGLNTPSWLNNNANIPLVSCQGTLDGTVPYDCNDVFWGDPTFGALDLVDICGSSVLHPIADAINLDNEVLIFEGDDHTPWGYDATKQDTMNAFITNFVYQRLACNQELVSITENNFEFNIQPNPVKDILSVRTSKNGQLTIYNLIGNKVYETDVLDKVTIDFSEFQNGVYFLNLKVDSKSYIEKVIKN